jgi:GTP-binding protein
MVVRNSERIGLFSKIFRQGGRGLFVYARSVNRRDLYHIISPSAKIHMPNSDPIMPHQPYASARFVTSSARFKQAPETDNPEVAFAGRSNVGKSSVLNRLCQQKNLARTSRTPGRTQLLNFFRLHNGVMLVDLPGYGYAAVPEALKKSWGTLVEGYLSHRDALRGLVLVTDIRRPLREQDLQLLDWCAHRFLPVLLVLNKSDKLGHGATQQAMREVHSVMSGYPGELNVIAFSAQSGKGLEALQSHLDHWLEV